MSYAQPRSRLARAGNTSSPAATATVTATSSSTEPQIDPASGIRIPPSGTLRLHADAATGSSQSQQSNNQRRVQWAEDVVNNEGMGRKSSKVCCIYHKPRQVGESSDEESSSSDDSSSDDDGETPNDDGSARPASGSKRNKHDRHPHDCTNHSHSSETHDRNSKRRINAYERIPKNN